jgi:hypothetical protein
MHFNTESNMHLMKEIFRKMSTSYSISRDMKTITCSKCHHHKSSPARQPLHKLSPRHDVAASRRNAPLEQFEYHYFMNAEAHYMPAPEKIDIRDFKKEAFASHIYLPPESIKT